ncbi:MAG: cell division protein ZapA [bacterium]|nr:cell division protein ZapA [bacterium]
MANDTVIKILNREYFIKEQEDPLLLASLVEYLEGKMSEVSKRNNLVDTSRIAVHAALLISKELFEERNRSEDLNIKQEKKYAQMLEKLSNIIET